MWAFIDETRRFRAIALVLAGTLTGISARPEAKIRRFMRQSQKRVTVIRRRRAHVQGSAPASPMYRVKHRVGRLVEIAIWSPVSLEEVGRWGRDHNEVVASVQGEYLCFVDLREASVFPQAVVDAYVGIMKEEPGLLRTAALLPKSPMVAMQIRRMIREAGHPGRQPFEDEARLMDWFAPHLSALERARMANLLRQGGACDSSPDLSRPRAKAQS